MLSLSPESVFFAIVKAREFDVKDAVTEPDPGSNAADDKMYAVLEDHGDDPTVEELTSFIDNLNVDQQIDLVALSWLGRGDYTARDWQTVRQEAAELTTSTHPPTFSVCLCSAITSKKASRCSAIPARNSKSTACSGGSSFRSLFNDLATGK